MNTHQKIETLAEALDHEGEMLEFEVATKRIQGTEKYVSAVFFREPGEQHANLMHSGPRADSPEEAIESLLRALIARAKNGVLRISEAVAAVE